MLQIVKHQTRQWDVVNDNVTSVSVLTRLLWLEAERGATLKPLTARPGARHVHPCDESITVTAVIQRNWYRVTLAVRAHRVLKCTSNSVKHQCCCEDLLKQESPAIADKPARRESLPKIAPIRRAYNVVVNNTGLSAFV